jgi:hypothetical protein
MSSSQTGYINLNNRDMITAILGFGAVICSVIVLFGAMFTK